MSRMTVTFTESVVEDAALAWLEGLGYAVLHGPEIAAGEPAAERSDPNYRDVVLEGRLRAGARAAEPGPPARGARGRLPQADARRRAVAGRAQPRRPPDAGRRRDGRVPRARTAPSPAPRPGCIDFDDPDNNDWLAVNQFTVAEGQHTRRPDVVLFVNGLPLAVIELKNPADENADDLDAPSTSSRPTRQQIPALFAYQRGADRLRRRAGADRLADAPARSGSSPGAPSAGEDAGRRDAARAAGACWRACSRSGASST